MATHTSLGWTIASTIPNQEPMKLIAHITEREDTENDVEECDDFEQHSDDEDRAISTHDRIAMKLVDDSIKRENDFKLQLAVPFKTDKPRMPNNFTNALRRLRTQQKSLKGSEDLRGKYIEKIRRLCHCKNVLLMNSSRVQKT
jgi:hypothetical protein